MTVWVHIVDGEPTEVRMGNGVGDKLLNDRVEELLKDKDWVADTVNELYSSWGLHEKMKTEKGKKKVEDDIREQAKNEADNWLNHRYGFIKHGWLKVEVAE